MDLTKFKPLLAGTVNDITKLKFPLIASPKLDGIRCVVINGKALSRNLKPIPNKFIREYLERTVDGNVDGEIMIPGKDFNGVQSAVMSFEGEPNFVYMMFDTIEDKSYKTRIAPRFCMTDNIKQLENKHVFNLDELIALEDKWVSEGYEGIMLRSPDGKYKFGRSTENEGILLKWKRFHDAEAVVVGFEEKMHNDNELGKDELGHAKRSSAKAGMIPANTLGALIVRMPDGKEFKIGTGFNDIQRKDIWINSDIYIGDTITYKYQELSSYGIPRFPVFKCFRL